MSMGSDLQMGYSIEGIHNNESCTLHLETGPLYSSSSSHLFLSFRGFIEMIFFHQWKTYVQPCNVCGTGKYFSTYILFLEYLMNN